MQVCSEEEEEGRGEAAAAAAADKRELQLISEQLCAAFHLLSSNRNQTFII